MRLRLSAPRAALLCLRARLSVTTHASEYDYVVVGAGSAGCTITYRLSESGCSVCLLEAGPPSDIWQVKMPYFIGWSKLISNRTYDWAYSTVPQKHMNNRTIYWPRGKCIGGTSSINTMVFMRGHALDYDRWANEENCPGWSYAHVLPYFKRMETYHSDTDYDIDEMRKYRGDSGPLHVTHGKVRNRKSGIEVAQTFLDAAVEAGHSFTHDFNAYKQEGVGWFDATVYNGERMSTGNMLKLAKHASSVNVRTNVFCTKVLINEKKRAIGVQIINEKSMLETIYAKDIIICGGVINSPQLLMLSGIGDADHIKEAGVKPVINLPGVGLNLQDHVRIEVAYYSKRLNTHDKNTSNAEVLWHTKREGLLTTNLAEVGAQLRTNSNFLHPNVQVHFFPLAINDNLQLSDKPALLMSANTHREHSRGYITLKSANPFDYPVINPNLLSDIRDLDELVDTLKICRSLFKQRSFENYLINEMQPGATIVSDTDMQKWIRQYCNTVFHPCGTCKMGDIFKDRMSVIDPLSMQVYGVDGLRVVDASVMPSEVSGNLNGPTIMIADRASDLILGNTPLLHAEAPLWRK